MKLAALVLGIVTVGVLVFFWTERHNYPSHYSHAHPKDSNLLSEESEEFVVPFGLPPVPWPKDNPYTQKKAELGRLLYFDQRLSSNSTISCASCHGVQRAFADEQPLAIGINGNKGSRHSPTVINAAYEKKLFWDGRASSLEEQCMGPLGNMNEMTSIDNVHGAHQQIQQRIQSIKGYTPLFDEVFGAGQITMENIGKAIATFERTILSGDSPYDRYVAGDKTAMTVEQIHGYQVFKDVGCILCHAGPNFADGRFRNIGVGMDAEDPDLGRYNVTGAEEDWGAFKVPTLREIETTYPYMHDGSVSTLEEVIDYYDRGGTSNKNLHPLLQKPLHLTAEEKQALLSFMHALSGKGWQHFTEPEEFP